MNRKKMNKVFSVIFLAVFVLCNSLGAAAAPLSENIKSNAKYGNPEFITGNLTSPSGGKVENIVLNYLDNEKVKFKFNGIANESFSIQSKKQEEDGHTLVKIKQVYNKVPLFGYEQKAVIDKDGVLTSFSGTVVPNLDKQSKLKLEIKVKPDEAIATAETDLGLKPTYQNAPKADLIVYLNGDEAVYAYFVKLSFLDPKPGNWRYFVDAVSGKILNKYNMIEDVTETNTTNIGIGVLGDVKTIRVVKISDAVYGTVYYHSQDNTRGTGIFTYNMNHDKSVGDLGSDSNGIWNSSDQRAIVDAHYYAGTTYDYYKKTFGRNSYDGNGAVINSFVHYGTNFNNAFWDGYEMVYGDGNGTTFTQFSGGVDVVGHELTHAVTFNEANLTYENESGAISEAYSDIFGTLIEFYANRNPDWLIGEDIYTPGIPGDALRSMANPPLCKQPDCYADRYIGSSDYGGVHINSGIINKAAYLISQGGTHYGVKVTGIGRSKLGAIAYDALINYLTPNESFSNLRSHWIASATRLYGSGSAEVKAVTNAFNAVGVN